MGHTCYVQPDTKSACPRSEDDQEKPTAPKLEIRFGYDNFTNGYDKNNDVIYKYNELTKIEFQISLLPKGVGLHSICQSESDEQSEQAGAELGQAQPN